MILDYKYIKKDRKLSVSYVKENGMKAIYEFYVERFNHHHHHDYKPCDEDGIS